jgi:coenzyme PQQ precursor peptide PqqA
MLRAAPRALRPESPDCGRAGFGLIRSVSILTLSTCSAAIRQFPLIKQHFGLAKVSWLNSDIQAIPSQTSLWRTPMNKNERETTMAWTTPTLVEICIGLEINGYLPAEL